MTGAERLLDQQEEEAPQLRQPRSLVNGAPVPESLVAPEPRYMCYMCYLSLIWQTGRENTKKTIPEFLWDTELQF